ncbi:helix-turn-helix domain-containing protein [Labrys monachus]|uniref:Transcriptional regulator with XRE-family HTH domain n=1 Tax=Labrys monachus TaxID=217067 RepID=A0ABU0FNH1_9HYPH|nr:helix-turn-helix transcriptional regulator [Labrys monachus]MDQ0396155.1 transcriptional regulator with XRE-family HTH domain [Labrys monachus]
MAHPTAAQGFRDRLERVIAQAGLNQAGFARHVGIDRSTLSQLLSADNDRLPRAETLVAIAKGCRISIDWLLGLSQREQVGAELVEAVLTIETQAHAPFDERFLRWHAEAAGRKLRTVPMSFPDFMKTDEVMRFEYAAALGPEPNPLLTERRRHIIASIRDGGEMEACVSLQALQAFAEGRSQWQGLDAPARHAQLNAMAALTDELYPTLRLHLYDLRQTYSAPFTVFGHSRAAVYLGPTYLVLNASEHIRMLTRRFDDIVRSASIQPHATAAFLRDLAAPLPVRPLSLMNAG